MHVELKKLAPWMAHVVDSLAERLTHANMRIHPLLTGSCLYNVINQLCLLLPDIALDSGREYASETTFDSGEIIARIALDLALPISRARAVLEALSAMDVVELVGTQALRVPDPLRLRQFRDYCRALAEDRAAPDAAREFYAIYLEVAEMVAVADVFE